MQLVVTATTSEGEPVEVVSLIPLTGRPDTHSPEARAEIEALIADSLREAGLPEVAGSAIKQEDIRLGGMALPEPDYVQFIIDVVATPGALYGSFVATREIAKVLSRKLRQRFGYANRTAAELLAITAQHGNSIAQQEVMRRFDVPEDELTAVAESFNDSGGVFIYRGPDGSTFTVTIDSSEGVALHTVRQWPTAE